jgi:hypothetical protein
MRICDQVCALCAMTLTDRFHGPTLGFQHAAERSAFAAIAPK